MTIYKEGINENTFNLFFEDFDNLSDDEKGNDDSFLAFATIDLFTRYQSKNLFMRYLCMYKENILLDFDKISYNKDTKEYEYRDGELVLNFDILSRHIDNKKVRKILSSKKRLGECHSGSLIVCLGCPNSRIVTGYITVGSKRVLHSIAEYESNGEVYVLDYTSNLKMNKNQYVSLVNFCELSYIERSNVVDDFKVIFDKLKIDIRLYYLFRDEIIEDILKNEKLFNFDSNVVFFQKIYEQLEKKRK